MELIALLMIVGLPSNAIASVVGEVVKGFFGDGVFFLVWWFYFKKSKRVRNTYGDENLLHLWKLGARQHGANPETEAASFAASAPQFHETNYGSMVLDPRTEPCQVPDERITALPVATAPLTRHAEWYVIHAGKELGPLPLAELVEKVVAGEVGPDDLVKITGGLWAKARDFYILQQQFVLKNRTDEGRQEAHDKLAKKALPIGGCVLLAVVVLVACGLAASYLSSRLLAHRGSETEKVTILVAKKNVDIGVLLKNPQDLFTEKQFARGNEPKNGVVAYEVLKGKYLKRLLRKDDWVTPDDLTDDRNNCGLKDALFYFDRGHACSEKGDYDQAIKDYDQALRLDPTCGSIYLERGGAWAMKKEYDRAIKDYSEAIRLDPNEAFVYYCRAHAWWDKSDGDKAIKDYDEAIRLDPKDFRFVYCRGNALLHLGDNDKAIKDFDEAIRLDPNKACAYCDRGNAWIAKKDDDQAIKDCDQAIRLDRDNGYAYYNRGLAWNLKKEYDKAIKDFDEAIRVDPHYTWAFFNRGFTWSRKKDFDRAIKDLDEAIRLDPNEAVFYSCRGSAWYGKKEYDKARKDFNMASRLDPKRFPPRAQPGGPVPTQQRVAMFKDNLRLGMTAKQLRRFSNVPDKTEQYRPSEFIADFNFRVPDDAGVLVVRFMPFEVPGVLIPRYRVNLLFVLVRPDEPMLLQQWYYRSPN